MQVKSLHDWNLDPREAVQIQKELAGRIVEEPLEGPVERVAGVDVGIKEGRATAAVVVLRVPELDVVDVQVAQEPVRMPYIPGLLSFRECPVILRAFEALETEPDLVLVDGQGIAHPRRLGIAAHLGLFLDLPTVGCGKSRLCGKHGEPGVERGSKALLRDRDEVIGVVLRTRTKVKPLYISIGNRITLDEAVAQVLFCGGGYRLPEPTRLAHHAAAGKLKT